MQELYKHSIETDSKPVNKWGYSLFAAIVAMAFSSGKGWNFALLVFLSVLSAVFFAIFFIEIIANNRKQNRWKN